MENLTKEELEIRYGKGVFTISHDECCDKFGQRIANNISQYREKEEFILFCNCCEKKIVTEDISLSRCHFCDSADIK